MTIILGSSLLGINPLTGQDTYADSLRFVIQSANDEAAVRESYFLLGEHLVQRNPEEAQDIAEKLQADLDLNADSIYWSRLKYILAASHRWQGNYKTALGIYDQLYRYHTKRQDKPNIAKSGRLIGILNMYLGNNELAQRHLLEVAELYNEIGTKRQQASIANSLASFYLNIDQEDKAIERYKAALKQFEAINDSAGMAGTNANLGYIFSSRGEFELAEKHLMLQKAYNAFFPTGREMAFHHDFLGLLRQEQGRLEDAYIEHKKALDIRSELSSTYNLCESKLNTGEVLIKLGRVNEAIPLLKDVLSFDEHESLSQQEMAHELLAKAYEIQGEHLLALQEFKAYKWISDSIYSNNSIQVIAEKDAQYKKKEQDAEIAILAAQNEKGAAQLSRSRLILYGSLVVLAILAVFGFFILRQYSKIKLQNETIRKTLKDKDLLLHEIHHRVKNNLQIISSLLSLQSRYISDDTALEAIKDGRNRVQSMAILHKNLYREDDLTGVHMQSYFSNLIDGIYRSFNLSEDEVELDMDVEDMNLDVDTVIPIGLITNELITNSLKYAFEDKAKHAIIRISLKEISGLYQLEVSDNGIGIQDAVIAKKTEETFGQRMIHAFVNKLKATMSIDNKDGTAVTISIPKIHSA